MIAKLPCRCARDHLAVREVEILELVAAGQSNRQVGRELRLSQHTVASYVGAMMRRLHAANRAELVARAYACQLLDHDVWPPVSTGRTCWHCQETVVDQGRRGTVSGRNGTVAPIGTSKPGGREPLTATRRCDVGQ